MLAVCAHAKVNLALEVAGRRPDGFHDLVTLFVTLDWHDLVCVDVQRGAGRTAITVEGATADPSMAQPGELLDRTAGAVRTLAGPRGPALDITVRVDKRLPVAAGLGGGSADAAAVLRAAPAELARLGIPTCSDALRAQATVLGSDVTALLHGATALARGRGELLQHIPAAPGLDLCIAVAGLSSTAAVYAALTDSERCAEGRAQRLAGDLAAGRALRDEDMGSALEPAARRVNPALAEALDDLRAATGLAWPLTGSGGAVFQVVSSAAEARATAAAAQSRGIAARACRTLTTPFVLATQGT